MKNWKVAVKLSTTSHTKDGKIPEDLKDDAVKLTTDKKSAVIDMRFPIPDDPKTASATDWENALKKFKGWNKDGYPMQPTLASVIEAGAKAILRTAGAKIINDTIKAHVAGTEAAKEASGGMEIEK